MTRDLYNLNLLAKLMVLLHQILFTLAIAEVILVRISAEQVQSLHMVTPRYLELVTSSNSWPVMLISSPMSFELSVMIHIFFFFGS